MLTTNLHFNNVKRIKMSIPPLKTCRTETSTSWSIGLRLCKCRAPKWNLFDSSVVQVKQCRRHFCYFRGPAAAAAASPLSSNMRSRAFLCALLFGFRLKTIPAAAATASHVLEKRDNSLKCIHFTHRVAAANTVVGCHRCCRRRRWYPCDMCSWLLYRQITRVLMVL